MATPSIFAQPQYGTTKNPNSSSSASGGQWAPTAPITPTIGGNAPVKPAVTPSAFTGLTPQQQLEMRNKDPAGYSKMLTGAAAIAPKGAVPEKKPPVSPLSGSRMNAAMPGHFGPQKATAGWSAAESGVAPQPGGANVLGSQPSASTPSLPPLPGTPAPSLGSATPNPPAPPPPPVPPLPGMSPVASMAEDPKGSVAVPGEVSAAVVPPPVRAVSKAPDASTPQAAPPPALSSPAAGKAPDGYTSAPPSNPQPGDYGEWGFVGKQGKVIDWSSASWNSLKHNPHLTAEQYIQHSPEPAKGFYQHYNISMTNKAPPLSSYKGEPQAIAWDASPTSFEDANHPNYIEDKGLRRLAAKAAVWAGEALEYSQAKPGSYNPKVMQQAQQKANAAQALLERYGIYYNPRGSGVGDGAPGADPPLPGGGEGGDSPTPGTGDPGTGTGGGDPPLPGTGSGDGPGDGPGDPGVEGDPYGPNGEGYNFRSDERDILDRGNTDLKTTLDPTRDIALDIKGAFNDKPGGMTAAEWSTMLEYERQREKDEDAMQRQQKGVNLKESDLNRIQNDPMRVKAEALAMEHLNNPLAVDYTGIRNRRATDSDEALRQSIEAASISAGRRGIDPGAMAGFAGNLTAENRNQLSRDLGMLTTEEQLALRAGESSAITQAANTNRAFSGAESVAMGMLANAVMGTPEASANPYEGMADSAANIAAIEAYRKALEDAKDAEPSKWGAIGGGVLGGVAGFAAGGPTGIGPGFQVGSSVGGML